MNFSYNSYFPLLFIHYLSSMYQEIHSKCNKSMYILSIAIRFFFISMRRYDKEKRISKHNETKSNETFFFFLLNLASTDFSAFNSHWYRPTCLYNLFFPLITALCYTKFSTFSQFLYFFSFIPFFLVFNIFCKYIDIRF